MANLISNPDKIFWSEEGYTKLDLARFYEAIFPKLKPYVVGRLLTMKCCPDGMLGECFYQKEAPTSLPGDTPTKLIHHANRDVHYVVGGSLETQLALVGTTGACEYGDPSGPVIQSSFDAASLA